MSLRVADKNFQPGQAVILQVDAYTVDDVPILKNTPVTIHTSSSYKIDRRISVSFALEANDDRLLI